MVPVPRIDVRPDHWVMVRDILRKHVPKHAVWAFGSRAKWLAKEYSDLDLAVISDQPLGLSVSAALADDFAESDLPWKVDVVDWATTSESFRKVIARDKVVVQQQNLSSAHSLSTSETEWTNSWLPHRLGNVAEVVTGFPFKSDQYTDELSGVRLLRGDNIAQGALRWEGVKRWPPELAVALDQYRLQPGDVVLAMDRPWIEAGLKFACVSKHDLPALLVQRVALLRARQDLDSSFLRYVIGSRAFTDHVLAVQTGTAVPHISARQIKEFEFRAPRLPIQHKIAQILGGLDDKIELNHRMSQTLEAIAQAIFKSWFVDFEPVIAKVSGEPATSIGERLGMTEEVLASFPGNLEKVGEVPAGWRYRPLSELTSYLSRGISPKYVDAGGVVVLNQKCVRDHRVSTRDARRHDPSQRSVQGRELQINDILVNSTGVGTLGRVAQIMTLDEATIVDSHLTVVRADLNKTTANYLGMALYNRQGDIEAMGDGSTGQTELSRARLAAMTVLAPPSEVLIHFDNRTASLRQAVAQLDRQNETLALTRNALLPRLLSGALQVGEEVAA